VADKIIKMQWPHTAAQIQNIASLGGSCNLSMFKDTALAVRGGSMRAIGAIAPP